MLLQQLRRDGNATYGMGDPMHPENKVLDSYAELRVAPGSKTWTPAISQNPTSTVVLYAQGGSPEGGDLVLLPNGRLGGGSYGSVYKGTVRERDGRVIPVAVKLTHIATAKPPRVFINEVLTMWDNSSDPSCEIYATCLYGVFKTTFGSVNEESFYYGIIMESMEGDLKTLCAAIAANPGNTPAAKLYFLMHCGLHMIYDVSRLHERGYFHKDVKPANFLYTTMENGRPRIKLSDFGLSCSKKNSQIDMRLAQFREMHKIKLSWEFRKMYIPCYAGGTRDYMTPTLLMYASDLPREIDSPSLFTENDIYALWVSVRKMADWIGLGPMDNLTAYDGTPVSEALHAHRYTIEEMLNDYARAVEYLEKLRVPFAYPARTPSVLSIRPDDISMFTSSAGSFESDTL